MKYNEILTEDFLNLEYWGKNKSTFEIAREVGCSKRTILDYMIKFDIKRRAQKGLKKSNIARKNMSESQKKYFRTHLRARKGEKGHNFKTGQTNHSGYILTLSLNHPQKNNKGYVREQRLVIEVEIGRYLTAEETVHHEDRNKQNNASWNLMAFSSKSAHIRWHNNPDNVKPEEIIFDGRKLTEGD